MSEHGTWHPTAAADLLRGWHEMFDPSEPDLQDYAFLHPILHGLVIDPGSNIVECMKPVDHWFSEYDGHGIYPPEDLAGNSFHWETILDTTMLWRKGPFHIIRTARTTTHVYFSISLHGCWGQASPTEYVRRQKL